MNEENITRRKTEYYYILEKIYKKPNNKHYCNELAFNCY